MTRDRPEPLAAAGMSVTAAGARAAAEHARTDTSVTAPDPPPIEPLLVRVEEAARLLSLSRSTIYEMLDSGELPSVRRGTARRIPLAALRAWVAQQVERAAHDRPGGGPPEG